MIKYIPHMILLMIIAYVIVIGSTVYVTVLNMYLTAERSSEPKLYCWYNETNGIVVYAYECLSTNEFLTDQDEVFNHKSCVSWEDYHGKEKEVITK